MSLALKPTHATVKAYYETLGQFGQLYIDHEGAVRSAFQTLLAKCGQRAQPKLTLVPEYRISRAKRSSVIVDGALVDLYHLPLPPRIARQDCRHLALLRRNSTQRIC